MVTKKKYVTDSTVFYTGIPYQTNFDFVYYITPDIFDEIKHINKNVDGLNLLISLHRVIIREPTLEKINAVRRASMKEGQNNLSKADKSIIALSLEMKLPLFSSDYALINTAKRFSIHTIIPGKKNFVVRDTIKYCSICKKRYQIEQEYCNLCGNKLIFKTTRSIYD